MSKHDNGFIIKGLPSLKPIPDISVGKLIYDKLSTICNENEALIDAVTAQSVSYRDLLGKTCSLAESLKKCGFNHKTIITICSENCVEFFIPVIAALYIGATIAPVNYNYTENELSHALNLAKPSVIFCSRLAYSKIFHLKLPFIKKIIIINEKETDSGGTPETISSFLLQCLGSNDLLYTFNIASVNSENHVSFILYSSGTTGLPKGVMITDRNVITKFIHSEDPRLVSCEKNRTSLGLLPFFHAFGLFLGLAAICKEIKIVVLNKFEEKLFLSTLEKFKITSIGLVPPLAMLLAKSPLLDNYDLSSVKEVGCGAAPLSKDIEELVKKRLKLDSISQGYGLTEVTFSAMANYAGVEKFGSCGKLYPYMMCKVRNPESGKSLGPNQVGELCFKGPLVMKGYYNNEEATRNAFTSDGWLLTGDLGYYDEEECFFIVGRIKELIKYKGLQVAPAELEAILLTNPKIKDAAVIGLPDKEAGELPLAFIVRAPNCNLSEEDVNEFLDGKVSSYKKLRGGVKFVKEIPKNASGKILRRKLQEMLTINKAKL